MKRILLAALLGGLAAFVWSSISHTVLPLGEAGVRTLPNEEATLEGLRGSIPEPGLYLFPLMGNPSEATEEEQKQWAEKYRTGPAGILVYRPVGGEFNFPRLLVVELLTNILAALIAALLLARMAGSYFSVCSLWQLWVFLPGSPSASAIGIGTTFRRASSLPKGSISFSAGWSPVS